MCTTTPIAGRQAPSSISASQPATHSRTHVLTLDVAAEVELAELQQAVRHALVHAALVRHALTTTT